MLVAGLFHWHSSSRVFYFISLRMRRQLSLAMHDGNDADSMGLWGNTFAKVGSPDERASNAEVQKGLRAALKSSYFMASRYTNAAPPPYSASQAAPGPRRNPPQYSLPTRFTIGDTQTDGPLVTVPQVKGHLALLHAFSKLKQHVIGYQGDLPFAPADAEKRWAWFVNMSVERSVNFTMHKGVR